MKAMVFAAGVGSRLRPLTDALPKALVEVGGRTMLERVLLRLKEAGVTGVVINTFHLPAPIRELLRRRDNFGLDVRFSEERVLLETGGGLKKAAAFFDDGRPFFVHNVDVLSEIDLAALYRAHEASGALATLAVHDRPSSRKLRFDSRGRLLGRGAGDGALAFAGIHVISPGLFALLTETGAFSITDAYVRLAAEGQDIRACRVDGAYWADIGSAEKLEAARRRFADGIRPKK